MKLVGISPTEKNSTLVDSLISFIQEQNLENKELKKEYIELARGIFRKLPSYLAIESDLKALFDIICRSHQVIKNQNTRVSINHFDLLNLDNNQGLLICLNDRPFIVDTISEFFKEENIELLCFTHPIIELTENAANNILSLSFLQIEKNSFKDLPKLLKNLTERLESLTLVTDHFQKILENLNLAIDFVKNSNDELKEEITAFLKWLKDDGFIFLGYFSTDSNENSKLGIACESSKKLVPNLDSALKENIDFIKSDERLLFWSKTTIKSVIHRTEYIDIISIKTNSGIIQNFIGIFSSKTRNQEAAATPILRKKLNDVLIEEGLIPNTHDYKELISLANTLPKSDFLQYSKEQVKSYFHEVTNAQVQGCLKLIHIVDRLSRFHYFTVAMPRERYSTKSVREIENTLKSAFKNKVIDLDTHAVLSESPYVLVRTMVPFDKNNQLSLELEQLEEIILEKTISWDEKFHINLSDVLEETKANTLYAFYSSAFSKAYQGTHNPSQALKDVIILESLTSERPLELSFFKLDSLDDPHLYKLRIFKRGEVLTLSNIVPYLSNCGFDAINEVVHPISTEGSVWANIYELDIKPKDVTIIISEELANQNLIPALKKLLIHESSNDLLNSLLINPGLSLSQIEVLRAVVRYLSQIKATSIPRHSIEALIFNPDIALLLIEYFDLKFNPKGSKDSIPSHDRLNSLSNLSNRIQKSLKKVTNITYDRILFTMHQVIDAMIRTNFYIREETPNISFKIDPEKINIMPSPKPYREIFVCASSFQGVHLRGGKIARGGLRWSSRPDDFRTEVLGLMKTQMVKNSVIVPVGAKGGFILHDEPTDRKELLQKVESTYKKFIRSLLDITDNRIGDQIKSPANCICYDEHDPYFVVAADRGTATFSDIANKIATDEYSFWLADAFASGGSVGYDHKKLGITAKGAWECAVRHFNELGIDISSQEFTVAGIGDMSGDVFGNGLIISNNAKLIAAFDHRHIFIDPNPNSKTSFQERLRLFNLASSSWDDYDKSLLSPGGFVVSRSEKEVSLSDEAKQALGTDIIKCSTNELIQIILKAPVDLLWNGGIGTYIKSSEEDHLKAADRTNDDVRVDAINLRTKIIAEGGNLGLTQAARIEYSKIGGKINTDAIDNSGGVDMSDLEVNLKLLFRKALTDGSITVEERNTALRNAEILACDKIVSRNHAQSTSLSLFAKHSRTNLSQYKELVEFFEKEKRINRSLDTLPTDETFEKRKQAKAGLTRPELAVLMAQAKMWTYDQLLTYQIINDATLDPVLCAYFPGEISEKFESLLKKHPLAREIIATQVANSFIERMGPTFPLVTSKQTGANYLEIYKSYLISESIIDAGNLTKQLKVLDNPVTSKIYISSLLDVQSILKDMTYWLIEDNSISLTISDSVSLFKTEFLKMLNAAELILSSAEKNAYDETLRNLLISGVQKQTAKILAASKYVSFFLDMIRASQKNGRNAIEIAKLHSILTNELQIGLVINFLSAHNSEDSWENMALNNLKLNFRNSLSNLCNTIISEENSTDSRAVSSFFEKRSNALNQLSETLSGLKHENISISSAYVVLNMLDNL